MYRLRWLVGCLLIGASLICGALVGSGAPPAVLASSPTGKVEMAPTMEYNPPPANPDDPHGRGFVPGPLGLEHLSAQPPSGDQTAPLLSRYDWREQGKVTRVQDQGPCGSCYAFASLASFESQLLVKGEGVYDFSENNLAECNYEETGCNGANMWQAANYMSTKGVVSEACDPYDPDDESCKTTCTPLKNLTDMWVLYGHAVPPVDSLKNWLQTYGPLYVTINSGSREATPLWGQEFSNYDGSYTLYHPSVDPSLTDHAVLLVGWDDSLAHAGGSGAWIVKNSWGTSWGGACGFGSERGFFTIAYGSASIGCDPAFVQQWRTYNPSSVLLYHDEAGIKNAIGSQGTTEMYGLAKFVPGQSNCATAVEIWTTDATSIDVEIYDSFNGSSTSSKLWESKGISFAFPGYHSIPIQPPLQLTAGNDIAVKVEFDNVSAWAALPIDNLGPATAGKSYYSLTGDSGTWFDLATSDFHGDVGIRVRTGPCATTPTPTRTNTVALTNTPTLTRTPTRTPTGATHTPAPKIGRAWLPLLLKAQPQPTPTRTATRGVTPTLTPTPRDVKPEDGYWEGMDGDVSFFVTENHAYVDDFQIIVAVDDCGRWEITHQPLEPISNGAFSFNGPFYANGVFSSATQCSGQTGLRDFEIPGCGLVSGGPWSYTATWQGTNMTMRIEIPGEDVAVRPVSVDSHAKSFAARRAQR